MYAQRRSGPLTAFLLQMAFALVVMGAVWAGGYQCYDTLGLKTVTVRASVIDRTDTAASTDWIWTYNAPLKVMLPQPLPTPAEIRLVLDVKPTAGAGVPAEQLAVQVDADCPGRYAKGESVLVDVARTRLSAQTLVMAVQGLDGPACHAETDR